MIDTDTVWNMPTNGTSSTDDSCEEYGRRRCGRADETGRVFRWRRWRCGGDGGDGGDGGGDGGDDYPSHGNARSRATRSRRIQRTTDRSLLLGGTVELRAYELAQKHLNNGGGWVDSFEALSGDGVLGYTVDSVNGDTATDADTARQAASRMINRDDVVMIQAALRVQWPRRAGPLSTENVMFMACLTQSTSRLGKTRRGRVPGDVQLVSVRPGARTGA